MILGFTGCWMTARDHHLCYRLLQELERSGSALAVALRDRLERAVLVDSGKLPATVVTLDSCVEYLLDDSVTERRILVHRDELQTVGLHLPLATPRGIALIGLREGQETRFQENGRWRRLRVMRVGFRPDRPGTVPVPPAGDVGAVLVDLEVARMARRAACEPNLNVSRKKETR